MAQKPFARVIELMLDKYGPEAARAKHIAIAKEGIANFIARQEIKPEVTLVVDGRPAASEEAVKPFGIIEYRLARPQEVAAFALKEARRISPVRSGRYRNSWFAMVNGAEVSETDIKASDVVIITNDQPYSRKIHTGAKGFEKYVPPGIVEKVRQTVLRKYRYLVKAEVKFITLQRGYVLKTSANTRRRDRQRGAELSYPALIITPRLYEGLNG